MCSSPEFSMPSSRLPLALLLFLGASFLNDSLQHLMERCDQLASMGALGVIIFVGIYLWSSLFCMPCLPFTLLAGAIFGLGWGTLAVMLGLAGGAAANPSSSVFGVFLGFIREDGRFTGRFSPLHCAPVPQRAICTEARPGSRQSRCPQLPSGHRPALDHWSSPGRQPAPRIFPNVFSRFVPLEWTAHRDFAE